MLFDHPAYEAEFQTDLDVGAVLGVELLSTPEVADGAVSFTVRLLLGQAASGTDCGLANLCSNALIGMSVSSRSRIC